MYVRGSRADYDGWESLGNKGWGWDGMAPYFRKHQCYDPNGDVHPDPQFMPYAAKENHHGSDGPVHTSFNDYYEVSLAVLRVYTDKYTDIYEPFEYDFCKAAYEVGGKPSTLVDAWSGDHMGFYSSLAAVNRTTDPGRRSYAATGYLLPNISRSNLKVLTEAMATKIVLDGNVATGIEFERDGKRYTVHVSKEVILSSGVIQSPQLLELSGIGDRKVLEAAGVEPKIDNERVGKNFQDHVLGGVLYDLADGLTSLDSLHGVEYAKAQEKIYRETHNGPYGSPGMLMGFVSYASLVDQETLNRTIAEAREHSVAETEFEKAQEEIIIKQLSDPTFANIQTFCMIQASHTFNSQGMLTRITGIGAQLDVSQGQSQIEFFSAPPEGKTRASLLVCLEHPLSRGSVNITSSDPFQPPSIDTGYLKHPVDTKILAEGIKWMDKVASRPVLAKSLGDRILPPKDKSIETEEERMDYVRGHISTQYHLIGTYVFRALGKG